MLLFSLHVNSNSLFYFEEPPMEQKVFTELTTDNFIARILLHMQ